MTRFFFLLVLLPALGAILLTVALTDPDPAVPPAGPPRPADVAAARTAGEGLRRALRGEAEELRIETDAVGSAVRLAARVLPELRADARVAGGDLRLRLSLPMHLPGGQRWLNLAASVPPFDAGLTLRELTLGGVALPPDLTLDLLRAGANVALGDRMGDRVLGLVQGLEIGEEALVLTLGPATGGEGGLARRVVAALHGGELPPPERVAGDYAAIRAAIDAGELPEDGTVLPHLRFALDRAGAAAGGDVGESYTAAILALARACGGPEARDIPESLTGPVADAGWQRDCHSVTLGGRTDLRQHFLLSAALKALANRGFAVSLGEFKELHDTRAGGSGFDFTDIAANNAGIRLSDRLMAAPPGAWPALVARIRAESDILPRLQGLPGRMTESAFEARFGSVDSPAYRAVLDEIEARIDALPLHATPD